MDSESETQTFSKTTLNFKGFDLKTPGIFQDLLGEKFALIESSGDQNLTNFILHFHVLCPPPSTGGNDFKNEVQGKSYNLFFARKGCDSKVIPVLSWSQLEL